MIAEKSFTNPPTAEFKSLSRPGPGCGGAESARVQADRVRTGRERNVAEDDGLHRVWRLRADDLAVHCQRMTVDGLPLLRTLIPAGHFLQRQLIKPHLLVGERQVPRLRQTRSRYSQQASTSGYE